MQQLTASSPGLGMRQHAATDQPASPLSSQPSQVMSVGVRHSNHCVSSHPWYPVQEQPWPGLLANCIWEACPATCHQCLCHTRHAPSPPRNPGWCSHCWHIAAYHMGTAAQGGKLSRLLRDILLIGGLSGLGRVDHRLKCNLMAQRTMQARRKGPHSSKSQQCHAFSTTGKVACKGLGHAGSKYASNQQPPGCDAQPVVARL